MKLVINCCFGGFSLSHEGILRYAELAGIKLYAEQVPVIPGNQQIKDWVYSLVPWDQRGPYLDDEAFNTASTEARKASNDLWRQQTFYYGDLKRDDPALIALVEEGKKEHAGWFAELKVVEIPDGVDYTIEEYDGVEHIAEVHRTWA